MRRTLCALALHVAALSAFAQTPAEAPPAPKPAAVKVEPAQLVPEEVFAAELKDFYDVSFTLGEYRGRVFVLNLWASWCGPCRMEIPELNKLYEEYGPRGVEFVGLTTESQGAESEKVREFARAYAMSYRVGWADPDVAAALMTRRAIPQTLVVGRDGRILARFIGYSKNVSQMLRAAVDRALEPPPEVKEEQKAEGRKEKEEARPAPSPSPVAPETSRPPGA